ncbi:MAG: hypothetical protein K2P44_04815 [Lachnospiraceae bacterium]|nr:hypothetical protein [Lachnospiraceae bacterium]
METTKEKILTIIKENEFRIFVNEHIDNDDVFLEQYRRAASMMNEIIGASDEKNHMWKDHEYENNIIAFCGERGEGKSSVMTTFVNAACNYSRDIDYGNSKFFETYKNEHMNNLYLADPVIIDPSTFDNVHNVLDIILAKIFSKFNDKYEEDNACVDARTREALIDQFQKVYKCVSLINNQTKMLDDEFDYEGNISKLSKLGESTNLKRELKKLVAEYLEFMEKCQKKTSVSAKKFLIIAIDDLDLCNSNVYKMAEQIRKYLIVPQIIIVMAVRMEQLKLCVQEMNLHEFQMLSKSSEQAMIADETKTMAERYAAKLIPIARRIYLPSVQEIANTHITYKKSANGAVIWDSKHNGGTGQDAVHKLVVPILDLLYQKTGMRFLPEKNGNSFLLPYNLRDMINLIVMLIDMENPSGEDEIYYKNIQQFRRYFEKEWLGSLQYAGMADEMQEMTRMDIDELHYNTYWWLEKIYKKSERRKDDPNISVIAKFLSISGKTKQRQDNKFYESIEWFAVFDKNVYESKEKQYAYGFRTLYTIRLNELLRQRNYGGMSLMLNGYIWGDRFVNILPGEQTEKLDRTRFTFDTRECFSELYRFINEGEKGISIQSVSDKYMVSTIGTEDIEKNMLPWTLFGMFANIYKKGNYYGSYSSDGVIIYDNYQIVSEVQISLENYLVGLVNLDIIYEKVNMSKLGIDKNKFMSKMESWKKCNEDAIELARSLVSNVDVLLEILDYCIDNRDYKEASEGKRTRKLVDKFFDNVEEFMKKHGFSKGVEKLRYFYYGDSAAVNISELYAGLFDKDVLLIQTRNKKVDTLIFEFEAKLRGETKEVEWKNNYERVSTYLVNQNANNAKKNLETLAYNVCHSLAMGDKKLSEGRVSALTIYYMDVLEICQQDDKTLPSEMLKEYKDIMREMQNINPKYIGLNQEP